MSTMALNSMMETYPTKVYKLNGFTIVPMYNVKNRYALPGGRYTTEESLLKAGAKLEYEMLWKRAS
jgi:hypothetical protein